MDERIVLLGSSLNIFHHKLVERINRYEKEKSYYPLFSSSDDDRHNDGLFIGTQTRKHRRSDPENHDHDDRKTHTPREADHHHNNRK
jgi:hypothetical protein